MEPYILIVDDDPDAREILQMVLSALPIRILDAHDGVEALIFVRALAPLLIVLDLAMPHLNGEEVLRELRSNPNMAQIPVIIFTAHAADDESVQRLGVSAERVVRKGGISMALLRDTIFDLLKQQGVAIEK